MDVKKIYQQLLKKYGQQGWWPLVVKSYKVRKVKSCELRQEFGLSYGVPYKKLASFKTSFRDPYFEIAVGAILTQNTAWKNVAIAIQNLYKAKALTPRRLLKLTTAKLQKLIKPAGYFRQKTKKLKLFSKWLVENHQGEILNLKKYAIGDMRHKLLEQWGIGPETADSILLFGLNKPIFVVDEYTRRLCKKIGVVYNNYDKYRFLFEKKLPRRTKIYQEYHALIVAWGKNNNGF